jgi:hypothetical protein
MVNVVLVELPLSRVATTVAVVVVNEETLVKMVMEELVVCPLSTEMTLGEKLTPGVGEEKVTWMPPPDAVVVMVAVALLTYPAAMLLWESVIPAMASMVTAMAALEVPPLPVAVMVSLTMGLVRLELVESVKAALVAPCGMVTVEPVL